MSTDRPDDLGAVAADDRWIEQLLAGEHDRDDALAVALAAWSDESREPVGPAPDVTAAPASRPVEAASRRWSRPRGARLVGLVASLGLIFSSGVGQAVAEDPAAPLRFVLDRGVSLGERLVGDAPHQVEGAPADGAVDDAESSRGDGPAASRAHEGRPPLSDLSAPEAHRAGEGPRPAPPSLIDPSPDVAGESADADEAEDAEQEIGSAAQERGPQPPPSPSAGPSAAPSTSPPGGSSSEPSARPSSAATSSPSPSPTRSPQQGLRPPSAGVGPVPVRPALPLPIVPTPTLEEPTPSPTPDLSAEPSGEPSGPPSSAAPRDDAAPGS